MRNGSRSCAATSLRQAGDLVVVVRHTEVRAALVALLAASVSTACAVSSPEPSTDGGGRDTSDLDASDRPYGFLTKGDIPEGETEASMWPAYCQCPASGDCADRTEVIPMPYESSNHPLFCPGEPLGCGIVRGDDFCDVYPSTYEFDSDWLKTQPAERYFEHVANPAGGSVRDEHLGVLECFLREGCPALSYSTRIALPELESLGSLTNVATQYAMTPSGALVFSVFLHAPWVDETGRERSGHMIFQRLDSYGELEWLHVGIGPSHLAAIPGTEDVLVQIPWMAYPECQRVSSIVRMDRYGEPVWAVSKFGSPGNRPREFCVDADREEVVFSNAISVSQIYAFRSLHDTNGETCATVKSVASGNAFVARDGVVIRATTSRASVVESSSGAGRTFWTVDPDSRRYTSGLIEGRDAPVAVPWYGEALLTYTQHELAIYGYDGERLAAQSLLDLAGYPDPEEPGNGVVEFGRTPIIDHYGQVWAYVLLRGYSGTFVLHDVENSGPITTMGPFRQMVVLQDGTMIADLQGRELIALDTADPRGGVLWSLQFPGMEIWRIRDDGTLVVLSEHGAYMHYKLVHGGVAHTPSPMYGMDMAHTNVARPGPYPDGPEIERRWVRAETADGSGD